MEIDPSTQPRRRSWLHGARAAIAPLTWIALLYLSAFAALAFMPLAEPRRTLVAFALALLGGLGTAIAYRRTLARRSVARHAPSGETLPAPAPQALPACGRDLPQGSDTTDCGDGTRWTRDQPHMISSPWSPTHLLRWTPCAGAERTWFVRVAHRPRKSIAARRRPTGGSKQRRIAGPGAVFRGSPAIRGRCGAKRWTSIAARVRAHRLRRAEGVGGEPR